MESGKQRYALYPVAVAILVVLAAVVVGRADVSNAGLVGWWRFDEASGVVAHDTSGSGNNGIVSGLAYFTDDPQMGQVLEVAGPSGQVEIPHSPVLEPETGTIVLWIKPSEKQYADLVYKKTNRLIERDVPYVVYVYLVRLYANGAIQACIANDNPDIKWLQLVNWTPAQVVNIGEWNQVAMRWDNRAWTIFVNGKLVLVQPYTPTPGSGLSYSGNFPVMVGAHFFEPSANNGFFDYRGRMSDLRLYSRPLSEDEIAALYAERMQDFAPGRGVKGPKNY